MTDGDPIGLAVHVAGILDDLGIPYALGGSLAASFFGEARSTADIDIAISVGQADLEELLGSAEPEFYVSALSAREALLSHGSFNLISNADALKVDLFVLGGGLLDRRQLERRVRVVLPGSRSALWVTSPEDQVLRKLDWYRLGGMASDRQWRDIIGILRVRSGALDDEYLDSTAPAVGLSELLERARQAAAAD